MNDLFLEPVDGSGALLKNALLAASLPVDNLEDSGRSFFALREDAGRVIAFSGLEACGADVLLRSMVVLPERRGQGIGLTLAEMTIARVAPEADVYLATTTATPFFQRIGFEVVNRSDLPTAILSTRQLSGLCPASATIMKLTRAPT